MPTPSQSGATGTPSWSVGDLTVRRIDEVRLPAPTGPWLLPGATPEVVAQAPWLQPDFADHDGILRLASHSFAFEVNGMRVLVDTGIGNGKQRANPAWDNLDTRYLERLTGAGFAPETVDLVILTHLHTDHVGWNTRSDGASWVPTFPHARYVSARAEWDYWAGADMEEARRQMFRDSVDPVEEAGLLDLVHVPYEGAVIAPGVRLLPTPGHTPGQVAVELRSQGRPRSSPETASITPCRCSTPTWAAVSISIPSSRSGRVSGSSAHWPVPGPCSSAATSRRPQPAMWSPRTTPTGWSDRGPCVGRRLGVCRELPRPRPHRPYPRRPASTLPASGGLSVVGRDMVRSGGVSEGPVEDIDERTGG